MKQAQVALGEVGQEKQTIDAAGLGRPGHILNNCTSCCTEHRQVRAYFTWEGRGATGASLTTDKWGPGRDENRECRMIHEAVDAQPAGRMHVGHLCEAQHKIHKSVFN